MRPAFLLSFWLLLSVGVRAQTGDTHRFSLVVVNPQRQPVGGATIKLLQGGRILQNLVADSAGQAQFTELAKGSYRLLVSAIGSQPSTREIRLTERDLTRPEYDTLVLQPLHKELAEVTVTGHVPLIEKRRDKTIINVEASPINTGATVADVLERSPGVTMDRSGTIALNGKQPVLVMIDDKPTSLSAEDLYNLLSSMSATQVAKIELISNPPARYDAAGSAGIINIRTKKNASDGFNGVLTTSYGQGVYPKTNNTLVLNYKRGKVNAFANYGFNDVKYLTDLYAYRQYYDSAMNVTGILRQPASFAGIVKINTLKAGLDYAPASSTTLGFQVTGTDIHRSGNNTARAEWLAQDGKLDSSIITRSDPVNTFRNGAVNLNARQILSPKAELSGDFDYLHYAMEGDMQSDNQLQEAGGYDSIFRSGIPTTIDILTGRLNGSFSLGSGLTLSAGAKTSSSKTDNAAKYQNLLNGQWVNDDTRSNRFTYHETIQALYAAIEGRSGRLTYGAGLRYEYTSYTTRESQPLQTHDSVLTRDYGSLFPNASLSFTLDSTNTLTLGVGRRTDRPVYQTLNPLLYVINKYTYETGNPYLLPQYTWNIEGGYQHGELFTAGVTYSIMNNYFSQIFLSDTTGTILYYTQGNVGQVYDLGISASLNLSPLAWWSVQLATVFNHKQLNGFNGNVYTSTISQLNTNISNQLNLGRGYSGELSGFYTTRARNDIQELLYPAGQASMGVSKSVLKKKGTLKLSWRDIFYTGAMEGLTSFPNATEYFKLKRDSRVLTLSFTWRFGKTFKASQHSESGADEEKERVQNG